MKDEDRTKEQLISELVELRQRITELEKSETEHKRVEEALRESEENLRTIWDSVQIGVVVIDAETHVIVDVNTTAMEVIGTPREQIIGSVCHRYICPAERGRCPITDLGQRVDKSDRVVLKPDGSAVPVVKTVVPIMLKGRRHLLESFIDITERKRMEEVLRESEHKYRILFEGTLDGVVVIDAETMKAVLGNQAAAKMYGFDSVEDAIGMNLLDFIPPEDRERVARIVAEDMFEKDLRQLNEFRTITKDGREIWIEAVGVRTEYQGRLAGLISFRDVSERKRMEEALRESERRYRLFAENVTDVIWVLDMNLRPTYMSPSIERLLGYSVEESMTRRMEESLTPASLEVAAKTFAKALDIKEARRRERFKSRTLELEMIRKDGSTVWVDTTISFLYDPEGKLVEIMGILRDVSERKQAQEALKKYSERLEEMVEERTKELREAQEQLLRKERLAVLGQLAGGVGHELRNPLGAIKNASYFLNMALEKPEPEVKEVLEILDKEVVTSERIISSLLDFARPKSPVRRKVDINEVVQEALSRIKVAENVEVVSQLDGVLPTILADPDQLGQVFGNIILNAIQAMPEGGQLVVKSEVQSPEWVAVSFADTGVGIPEENLRKIFEPLFTTRAKGIGLGLAIVKSLVEGNRGTIEVQSEVGKGSTFTVRLPIGGEKEK